MFGSKKSFALALLIIGFSISLNCNSAEYPEPLRSFMVWMGQYAELGILPSDNEVRKKCHDLAVPEEKIDALVSIMHSPQAKQTNDSTNGYFEVCETTATTGRQSKSPATVKASKRLSILMDEVKTEKSTQDFQAFKTTRTQIGEIMKFLPARIDCEKVVEGTQDTITQMEIKNAPFVDERNAFKNELNGFKLREASENFDSESYMNDIMERFNRFTDKVNLKMHERN